MQLAKRIGRISRTRAAYTATADEIRIEKAGMEKCGYKSYLDILGNSNISSRAMEG